MALQVTKLEPRLLRTLALELTNETRIGPASQSIINSRCLALNDHNIRRCVPVTEVIVHLI